MTSEKKSTIGKFYSVSKGAIEQVAKHSERAAVVLAYLALKRYQQRQNPDVTTGGRMALAKVLGISERRAMKLMDELRAVAWGGSYQETALVNANAWNATCTEDELVSLGHPGGGKGSNKVMPPCGDDFIYLPNNLTEKAPRREFSPLGQLYRIRDKTVRLHATMMLLALYDHLDMQHFGGADPAETMFIPWRHEGNAKCEYASLPLGLLGNTDSFYFWAVDFRAQDGDHWSTFLSRTNWTFIESITGETKETEAKQFWAAWRSLRDLGLAFHAAMVFDVDPLTDPDAEILYPLWIFNKAEKKRLDDRGCHEGGLGQLVVNAAIRDDVSDELWEAVNEIYGSADGMVDNPSGFFVVAGRSMDTKVVGILRPRFIPNTQDGQAGWASIRDKAAEWSEQLK